MACPLCTTEIVEGGLLSCQGLINNAVSRLEYIPTCILWRGLFSALDAGDKNSRSVYTLDHRLPFVAPSVTLVSGEKSTKITNKPGSR